MSLLNHYRVLFEYETDCNHKMLVMLESVPDASRSDVRFQRAVMIACHLATCRENWLSHMDHAENGPGAWLDPKCEFASLPTRFSALERTWTDYLSRLDADQLARDFEFTDSGESFSLPIEVQIVQLFGHASYHRGQVALLVDQLGGETIDTDYADWWWAHRDEEREAGMAGSR